jgi:hypothetical protein
LDQACQYDVPEGFKEPEQADAVFAGPSALDWKKEVTGELFLAPTLKGGGIFLPALFAVYVLQASPEADYSVISANAAGVPQTPYVGLIDDKQGNYHSVTGFAFTYLSTAKNLLNYDLIYPDHPDKPYLTVHSAFLPAVSEERVSTYKDVHATKVIMMVQKGALMRDLIKMYYPDAHNAALWDAVGALKGTKFKDQLASLGLNLAVDLFDKDLWLEKPKVGSDKPMEYKLTPGLELNCEEKAAR